MSTEELSPIPLSSAPRWLRPLIAALLAFAAAFGIVRMWPSGVDVVAPVKPPDVGTTQVHRLLGIDKGSFMPAIDARPSQPATVSIERQAAFLREVRRREAAEWSALSSSEREEKRAEFKATMLEAQ